MLRGLIGDEAFFAGIRAYYARHLHSAVLSEDFQAVMEEASGRDLDGFFEQWLHQPGYPTFDVATEWAAASGGAGGTLTLRVRQVQKAAWPTFRVPMELLVVQDGREHRSRVEVSGRETVLRVDLPTGSAPSRVVLDPDGWVLKGG
jgi:aminopeptidase N